MTLNTTELLLARALSPEEQAGLLGTLDASPLFNTSSDPRLARSRPQFAFSPESGASTSVLCVTSHPADHPNVVRLVKVILKLP